MRGEKVCVQSVLFEYDSPPSPFTTDDLVRFRGWVKPRLFIFIFKILTLFDKSDNSVGGVSANSTTYTVLVACTILAPFTK